VVRTWHGRLAASGLHLNTVAKIYRLFRSIMTTAVDDDLIAGNPVRIEGASAERMDALMSSGPAWGAIDNSGAEPVRSAVPDAVAPFADQRSGRIVMRAKMGHLVAQEL